MLSRFRVRRRSVRAAAVVLFFPSGAFAAGFSFDDALQRAVEHAPLLDARRSQREAAHEDAARADALPDPRLTLGFVNLPVTGADAFDLRADDMTMRQLGLMQDVPSRVKRRARRELAERLDAQAESLSTAERLAVRRDVAQVWIALWAAQREAGALRALREPTAVAAQTAKARLAGGTGSAADALAAAAASLELDDRIDAADAALQAARAGLARRLATDPSDLAAVGTPPDLTKLPTAPAALLASIDRQAPLLSWDARAAVADAEVAAAAAERRPDWSLGVSYGRRSRTPEGMPRSDLLMVEFAIGLPVSARTRQDRGIAARRAGRDAVEAERADARLAQQEFVRRTLAEWDGLARQIARGEAQALPLARDRVQVALAAYAGGAELEPWLQARRDELELQAGHARHLEQLGRAWAALAYLLPAEGNAP